MAPPDPSFVNTTGVDRLEICAGIYGAGFTDTTNSSSINSVATAWEWNFGDNSANVTTQNVTGHIYQIAGNYTITLKASNVAGSNTVSKTNYVSVYGIPDPGFEAEPVTRVAPLTVISLINQMEFPRPGNGFW